MEDKPTSSRKKSIAATTILALAVMKPATKTELIVAVLITLIAVVAISWHGVLDYKKK